MRSARIQRNTRETSITLALTLDGLGKAEVSTGVGFLDHMLELLARHGDFDLAVRCEGDTQVDFHHSVEDIGICLGQAFTQALGDKRGITRYGQSLLPMDETLVLCACDLSGRDYLGWSVDFPAQKEILTQSLPRNFGWPLSETAPGRSISGKSPGGTPIIFWRPFSRAWAEP